MVRGERHLGGADQVQVVGLEPVDLARVRAEEPGALHRLRLDQHRRYDRDEAVLDRLLHGQLQQAELQQRADAGEEVEPGAGHLGAALDVDRAEQLAELQVVARVVDGRPLADLAQHDVVVLAAGRDAVLDDVGHGQVGPTQLGRRPRRCRRLGRLDLVGQLLGPREQGGPLVAGGLGHLLAELLLLGAQRLEPGNRRSARLVGREQVVDDRLGLAAGPLAGPDKVRILAQQSQVNHDA